jgi:hypothetical protein
LVFGLNSKMSKIEQVHRVFVSEEYLEDTYNVPEEADPLTLAKEHRDELEDIAVIRAATGQHDADGIIRITPGRR